MQVSGKGGFVRLTNSWLENNRSRIGYGVFAFLFASAPLYFFSNWDKFGTNKSPFQWFGERGWKWRLIPTAIIWFVVCALLALFVYWLLGGLSRWVERRRAPKLEILFEDRPPFAINKGPSPLGIFYKKRLVAVKSSTGGKVSLKIPELTIPLGTFPNVHLRPIENQADELEPDELGYWEVIQMNTSDRSMKVLHKGSEEYDLGTQAQFEIVARCQGVSAAKVVTVNIVEDAKLDFRINSKDQAPELSPRKSEFLRPKDIDRSPDGKPKTLHDCFRTDFPTTLAVHQAFNMEVTDRKTGKTKWGLPIEMELLADYQAKSQFLAFYIPPSPEHTFDACATLAHTYKTNIENLKKNLIIDGGVRNEMTSWDELNFTGRIYIYHETYLSVGDKKRLTGIYDKEQLSVFFRGPEIMLERTNPTILTSGTAQPPELPSFDNSQKGDQHMDIATATALISAATSAVNLFDKVAGQVVRFISKTPEMPGPPKEFQFTVGGGNGELQVQAHGRVIQTITGADLKHLPPDYYSHIQTLEASLKRNYAVWKQVYPHRDDGDLVTNAKVHNQLSDLALKMKDDLAGIIDFLQRIGVQLDDHYMIYRDVIQRYDGV
jgi:hypothetical protein